MLALLWAFLFLASWGLNMRFSIGDYVVYGETGVCSVEEIVIKTMPDGEKECYKLKPLNQSFMIFTPTENGNVFMRAVITKEEADAMIADICSQEIVIHKGTSPRDLNEKYDRIIKTHDCGELLKLSRSIDEKRRVLAQQKRKLSAIDERFVKKAEDLLFGELAVVFGIKKTEVREYIENKIV